MKCMYCAMCAQPHIYGGVHVVRKMLTGKSQQQPQISSVLRHLPSSVSSPQLEALRSQGWSLPLLS